MTKSLSALMEALQKFDRHESRAWHESLKIEIPEGLLRYPSVALSPYEMWGDIIVLLGYGHKTLSFRVKICKRSRVSSKQVETATISDFGETAGKRERFCFTKPLSLTVKDARRLFFFLQEILRPVFSLRDNQSA